MLEMANVFFSSLFILCLFNHKLAAGETKAEFSICNRAVTAHGRGEVQNYGNASINLDDGVYLEGYIPDHMILEDFGVISYKNWNYPALSVGDTDSIGRFWYEETNSDGCTNVQDCRSQVRDISKGHVKYNFHVLPDGSILEGVGWDIISDNVCKINIFSESKDLLPTIQALDALAYLLQVGVCLGKVAKHFSIYNPSPAKTSVNVEVQRWARSYKISFDKDCSPSRVSAIDLQAISRLEWKAIAPMREMERSRKQAEVVQVNISYSDCLTQEECAQFVRDMQIEHKTTSADIHPNFVFGADGRIYEGLGWNWFRKENVVIFHIPLYPNGKISRTHVLAAFALKLAEGVDLGWISENFTIDALEVTEENITDWGELARGMWKDNTTGYLQTSDEGEIVIAQIDSEIDSGQNDTVPLEYPVGTIYFTQSYADCCRKVLDCLPLHKTLGRHTIRSPNEVKSNFYFYSDDAEFLVIHEGLGWGRTTRANQIVFEFVTPNATVVPPNKTMVASTFLIKEGLNKGIFRSDYRVIVARHVSFQFEDLVRFWDTRVRRSL